MTQEDAPNNVVTAEDVELDKKPKAPTRIGDKVKSLVDDGACVTIGLDGLVTNIISARGDRPSLAFVAWGNDTFSVANAGTLELLPKCVQTNSSVKEG
ncbi:MAG: hypothetical protein WBP22_00585 [Candidatus Saccharimonas sp.]